MANTVTEKTQLSNGVWVVPDGDKNWGSELNDNFMLLNGLLDRKTLTLTKNAQTVATFNGTQNVTVDIGTQFATNDDIDGLFGDSQVQPDLTKDVNVGNLDRFKTDLSSRVVSSVSLDNDDDLEVTYLDGQSHTVSLPWPEVPTSVVDASFSSNTNNLELTLSNNTTKNVSIPIPSVPTSVVDASFSSNTNNLELTLSDNTTKNVSIPIPTVPTSVVDGAIVDTNKLELTFSDQTTKQLTLPSGGSSPVTRTVTRVPMYFEVHFKSSDDSTKYTLDANDVKSLFTFSTTSEEDYNYTSHPNGIVVTDVTSTKALNANDAVFLVAVNLVNPRLLSENGNPIKIGCNKSFGNIQYSYNIDGTAQTINSLIYGCYEEIECGAGGCSETEYKNYYVIDAVVSAPSFAWTVEDIEEHPDVKTFLYDISAVTLTLSVDEGKFVNQETTFTEVV
jgi:hypothetical protein